MPTIKTGNAEWDQNLNTLGAALFPDPSKAASAYYYGTKSRESLLESAKTQNQLSALNTQVGMTFGRAPNPTYRPGPFDTSIMNDPYAVPAAPGPTAPPTPPGQAVSPQSALPTLAQAVTTMPPQAVANGIVAGVENNASSGPGPEPTGSNGTVPQNGPGTFRPGSVTSAGGGGVVMAGPAAPDGTPAPSSFNFGQAISLGVAAGQTPDQAYAVALGTLGNMVKNGQIALPLAEQMAAFYGRPQMRVQTQADQGALARTQLTEAGATTRTGMTEAGAMARQNLITGEGARQFNQALEQTTDEAGNPIFVRRVDATGKPAFNPTIANTRAAAGAAYGTYIDPADPLKTVTMTKARAEQLGLQEAPTTQEAVTARGSQALLQATPEQLPGLRARVTGATPAPKAPDPDDVAKAQFLVNQRLQARMPVPAGTRPFTNTNPAGGSPEFDTVLNDLTQQYLKSSPDKSVQGNPSAAADAALNQLQAQGYFNPNQDRGLGLGASTSTTKPIYNSKTGQVTGQAPHFRVELIDPATKKPFPTGRVPKVQMQPPVSGVVAPPPPAAPPATTTPAALAAPAAPTAPVPAPAAAAAPPPPAAPAAPIVSAAPGAAAPVPTAPAVPITPPAPPATFQQKLGALFSGQTPGGGFFAPPSTAAAPAVTAPAPTAPTGAAVAVANPGAPPGAVGPAPAGALEGATGRHRVTGAPVVNRGGWLYPAPQ